jgi:triphosphoribosyl-dephospho-CoA synthase
MDVRSAPPEDLRAAMRAAAHRDLVARQYAEDFRQVLGHVAPAIVAGRRAGWSLTDAVIHTHLRLMADFPDSLIARKCGQDVADASAHMAAEVLSAGEPGDAAYLQSLADLDFWLRADGHRRNPGTSADMIAAGLFVVLREGLIEPPYR